MLIVVLMAPLARTLMVPHINRPKSLHFQIEALEVNLITSKEDKLTTSSGSDFLTAIGFRV